MSITASIQNKYPPSLPSLLVIMDYLLVTITPDVIMASSYKCIDDDEKAIMDNLLQQASAYKGQGVVVKVKVREETLTPWVMIWCTQRKYIPIADAFLQVKLQLYI